MSHNNIELARNLRKNMTPQERKLWSLLRNKQFHNLSFRRQYPIGDYFVDFICWELNFVIEIDGGQHNEPKNIEYDKERTEFLNKQGLKVIRIWNNDIDNNIENVFEELSNFINSIK